MRSRTPVVLVPLAAAAVITYVRWVRPWQLTWGATSGEVARALPGDDLVTNPTFNATRAITIAAPPEEIWPWLVQAGTSRAGWYSYDILDNLGRPSARRIFPELQGLAVGDVVPMSPDGRHGIPVRTMDPPTSMVWGTPGDTTWTWELERISNRSTRLISRVRSRYRWFSPTIAFSVLLEFGDIWMMRRMLLNLRDRAEGVRKTNGRRRRAPDGAAPAFRADGAKRRDNALVHNHLDISYRLQPEMDVIDDPTLRVGVSGRPFASWAAFGRRVVLSVETFRVEFRYRPPLRRRERSRWRRGQRQAAVTLPRPWRRGPGGRG